MAICSLYATVSSFAGSSLLLNNPRTVDRFDVYNREMKKINDKKTRRTDEDYRELGNLEVRAKLFWDESLGVYVPGTWVSAAIAGGAFKIAKISKADVRGSVFVTQNKLKLSYSGQEKVVTPEDVVGNDFFREKMTLKQGQVRVVKYFPIFQDWSFEVGIEFDDKLIDPDSLKRIIEHCSKYGGFGDFRPTYGRAEAKVSFEG